MAPKAGFMTAKAVSMEEEEGWRRGGGDMRRSRTPLSLTTGAAPGPFQHRAHTPLTFLSLSLSLSSRPRTP